MFMEFMLAAYISGLEQKETHLHFTDEETEAQVGKETSFLKAQ